MKIVQRLMSLFSQQESRQAGKNTRRIAKSHVAENVRRERARAESKLNA
jgi:hypothetical protein